MHIFKLEMKTNRKTFITWTVILMLLILMVMWVYPSMNQDDLLQQYVDVFPESMIKALGLDKLSFSDPIGFYATEGYFMVILLGSMYAAILGSTILSKEEDEKTIEFLLARPVTRSQLVLQKMLVFVVYMVLFNTAMALATYGSFQWFVTGEYQTYELNLLLIAPLLLHVTFASLGFLISQFFSRRRSAFTAGIGMVLLLYFFDMISLITEKLEFLRGFTPFGYIRAADIVTNGKIDATNIIVLVGITLICITTTFVIYNKKDIIV